MGSGYWRKRHHKQEWTKTIDISFLHQLEQITQRLISKAKKEEDEELLKAAEQLDLIVSRANGDVANVNLAAHELPLLPFNRN
jgi:hypothetical protein